MNLMEPAVGSINRNTSRPVVDLPQPDSPTSANVSPRAISKLTFSTARTTPTNLGLIRPRFTGKCFTKPSTFSTGTPFMTSPRPAPSNKLHGDQRPCRAVEATPADSAGLQMGNEVQNGSR